MKNYDILKVIIVS